MERKNNALMGKRTPAPTNAREMALAYDYEQDIEDHLHNGQTPCISGIAPTREDGDRHDEQQTSTHREERRERERENNDNNNNNTESKRTTTPKANEQQQQQQQ